MKKEDMLGKGAAKQAANTIKKRQAKNRDALGQARAARGVQKKVGMKKGGCVRKK